MEKLTGLTKETVPTIVFICGDPNRVRGIQRFSILPRKLHVIENMYRMPGH